MYRSGALLNSFACGFCLAGCIVKIIQGDYSWATVNFLLAIINLIFILLNKE